MKLATLHPELIELYRQDGIALEQLTALTMTDDTDEQLRAWNAAPEWCRDPASLRRVLVSDEIDAARDPLVQLVGLDAYEAAGGAVRRDLFDDEGGGYVQDAALLARLADECCRRLLKWSGPKVGPGSTLRHRWATESCSTATRRVMAR